MTAQNKTSTRKPRNNNDIKSQIDQFVKTLGALQSVLARETDFLKHADRDGFFSLQKEKIRAVEAYQQDIKTLRDVSSDLKEKYPDMVGFLRQKQEELNAHINDNKVALERMENSTKRIGDRIMDIARQAAAEQNAFAYGAKGKIDENKRASMGVSESA